MLKLLLKKGVLGVLWSDTSKGKVLGVLWSVISKEGGAGCPVVGYV